MLGIPINSPLRANNTNPGLQKLFQKDMRRKNMSAYQPPINPPPAPVAQRPEEPDFLARRERTDKEGPAGPESPPLYVYQERERPHQ